MRLLAHPLMPWHSTDGLIANISKPVYSGAAGEGMHGAGIPTTDHIACARGLGLVLTVFLSAPRMCTSFRLDSD